MSGYFRRRTKRVTRRISMLAPQFVEAAPIQLTAQARQELVDLLTTARHAVNDDPESAHRALDQVSSMLRPAGSDYSVGGLAPWQLRLVCNFIDEHLSERITIDELASIARLSRSHFTRAFKASVGCPPHNFILQQRMERAKELMRESAEPLVQIALICGLADQSHLSRTFRAHVGCTPAAWRRVNQQPQAA
jgi:AraC-like DNA-binding protein